jgi:hypothetical protein
VPVLLSPRLIASSQNNLLYTQKNNYLCVKFGINRKKYYLCTAKVETLKHLNIQSSYEKNNLFQLDASIGIGAVLLL